MLTLVMVIIDLQPCTLETLITNMYSKTSKLVVLKPPGAQHLLNAMVLQEKLSYSLLPEQHCMASNKHHTIVALPQTCQAKQ